MSSLYYSDDLVQLFLGDCRECTSWLACDVLVTDPPYGIRWTGIATSYSRGIARSQRQPDIEGDSDTSVRDEILSMWGGGDRPWSSGRGGRRALRVCGIASSGTSGAWLRGLPVCLS